MHVFQGINEILQLEGEVRLNTLIFCVCGICINLQEREKTKWPQSCDQVPGQQFQSEARENVLRYMPSKGVKRSAT